ncbi:MAG: radical SAM protein [Planctomycetota bacterium]
MEPERARDGNIEDVATIFITNRECPFKCLMCDLWKNTTEQSVPPGAVPHQITEAIRSLPPAKHVKLYNAGSFFDPGAVPPSDYDAIIDLVAQFETVITEAHPSMIGRRCFDLANRLANKLEVAIGLETVDPEVLPRLNKQMTLDDFDEAVNRLIARNINVRAFILVKAPFQSESEGRFWARASLDHAFDVGVECCCIIPTRAGNGIMDALARQGQFSPPSIETIEDVMDYGIGLQRGRVFVDLWDVDSLLPCDHCRSARVERLQAMNLAQEIRPRISCACGDAA